MKDSTVFQWVPLLFETNGKFTFEKSGANQLLLLSQAKHGHHKKGKTVLLSGFILCDIFLLIWYFKKKEKILKYIFVLLRINVKVKLFFLRVKW